jgi:hypothetical protein
VCAFYGRYLFKFRRVLSKIEMNREFAILIHHTGDDSPPVIETYSHNYGIRVVDLALVADDMSACARFLRKVICATPEFKALIHQEFLPRGALNKLDAQPGLRHAYVLLTVLLTDLTC